MQSLRLVPGVNSIISAVLAREVAGAVKDLVGEDKAGERPVYRIPKKGVPADQLLKEMKELKDKETHAEEGKLFAYVRMF